jgi:hypothetical protein
MIERLLAPDSLAVALFNDSRFTALENKVAHSAISTAAPDNQRGSNTMSVCGRCQKGYQTKGSNPAF